VEVWLVVLRQPKLPVSLAGHVSGFVASLQALGVPWRSALGRAKLPDEPTDPLAQWPTQNLLSFLDDMARRAALPELGVMVGQSDHSGAVHPALAEPVQRSPSLYAALQAVCQCTHLQGSHVRIWTCASQDVLLLRHLGSVPAGYPGAALGEHFRVVRLIRMIRRFLGHDWQPEWLWLAAAEAPPASLRRFVGGCAIRGGQPCGVIPIPLRLVACPMPTVANGLSLAMGGSAPPADAQGDWLQRLRAVLESYLPGGGLTIEEIAEMAGMTPRTLQRQLADRGTTWRGLVDEVRFSSARQLLQGADELTMDEVAQATGYSDASNFARAFRRLCGRSPAQYRADQLPVR